MNLLILIASSMLWSVFCFANIKYSNFVQTNTFKFVDESSLKNVHLVSSMPKTVSQDSLPCGFISSFYIAQQALCQINNIQKCDQLSTDSKYAISELSFALVGSGKPINFEALNANNLITANKSFSLKNKSCINYDQIVNSFGEDEQKFNLFIGKLRSLYEQEEKQGNKVKCPSCLIEKVNTEANSFKLSFNLSNLQNELNSINDINQFIYGVFFANCLWDDVSIKKKPRPNVYPNLQDPNVKNEDMKNKIKELISRDRPMAVDGICLGTFNDSEGRKKCLNHSLVISGYGEICNSANSSNCKAVIKLQNTWGTGWQKNYGSNNNSDWVDLDTFLDVFEKSDGVPNPSKPFAFGSISWYELPEK